MIHEERAQLKKSEPETQFTRKFTRNIKELLEFKIILKNRKIKYSLEKE